jgi:hypothetical protein
MCRLTALTSFLSTGRRQELALSFADIEKIIGRDLPPSAFKYRPWWANEKHNFGRQCTAWMKAGYNTFPNMTQRVVVFRPMEQA